MVRRAAIFAAASKGQRQRLMRKRPCETDCSRQIYRIFQSFATYLGQTGQTWPVSTGEQVCHVEIS